MKQLKIVLNFEFMNYAKRKSFIALTLGLMIIVALVLSWPSISGLLGFGGDEDTDDDAPMLIALLDEADGLAGTAEYYNNVYQNSGTSFVAVTSSRQKAEESVESGDYESLIILVGPLEYIRVTRNICMYDDFAYGFEATMLAEYRQQSLSQYGVPAEDVDNILTAAVSGMVQTTQAGKDQRQNFFYTYILIFLLYMAIIIYGQLVATSVATEKSSRAMELLITSTEPKSLMFGKVLGASLAGIVQIVLVLGTAYLVYNLNEAQYESIPIIQSIFAMPLSMLLYTLLFFVLGFLLYAFLYAAMASLVSRIEDLSTVVMPITFLFIIAFMVVMFSMSSGNVDSTLMVFCSFLPLTSPMAMFTRIAMGEVASWQIVVSVVILIVSTIGVGVLSASIYRMGVLLYGTPPKPKAIIKMLRAQKTQSAR